MLLPQEIAEQLTPEEYESLCEKVFAKFKQGFSVVSVTKGPSKTVVIRLNDRTREEIKLSDK